MTEPSSPSQAWTEPWRQGLIMAGETLRESVTVDATLCDQCERPVPDSNPICEDCAWDIHDHLDGFTDD